MTETKRSPTTGQPGRYRGPGWVVAGLVAVLVVGCSNELATTTSPATATTAATATVAPDIEAMTDLEVIEAGVAAFYSGDGERAAELFELPNVTDDQIRTEAAYQAAIGGRLTLNCLDENTPGTFSCRTPYHNAMTDAIGFSDHGDTTRVVVEDGVITEFGFPAHWWMVIEMGLFLASEGRFDGYEDCDFGPYTESCATIQLENLDAWAEWREGLEPADVVEVALASWYGGECEAAQFATGADIDCSASSSPVQTIEYESILRAQVSVEDCEVTFAESDETSLSCDVRYSNALNSAVGKPPAVTARQFLVEFGVWVRHQPGLEAQWYEGGDYPEDTELRDSFRVFAESGELADAYASADCANARTAACANLILDNLDDWAAWYETNA